MTKAEALALLAQAPRSDRRHKALGKQPPNEYEGEGVA